MADANATEEEVKVEEEAVDETQGEDESEEEDFEGENLTLRHSKTTDRSLPSDFCKDEEYLCEDLGESRWICEETERTDRRYFEEIPYEGEFAGEEEEEEDDNEFFEQKRSLDSEYLKSVLGTPLTYALLEIATKRPTDPIQYLAHYLLKWKLCQNKKDEYERNVAELTKERDEYIEKMKEKERQEMLTKEQEEAQARLAEKVESSIDENYGEDDQILGEEE